MSEAPRYVVGIDLGTSNSAIAYADLEKVRAEGRPLIESLEILQLIAPGDLQQRKLLPSSLYQPAGYELEPEQAHLPWHEEIDQQKRGSLPKIAGEAAKRIGAKTPVRLVESAKSWLCHGGVNRTASILPWHAPDGVPKISPVEASSIYLNHLREAWNYQMAAEDSSLCLEKQAVIITVPASFDEIARRLTLEAAKKAGLKEPTLIEEPLAAFYAYVARTGGTAATTGLKGGERVLIADVGGGTTDFTLVEVSPPKDGPQGVLGFERTAVGDHLLLGGDNMDLALAHAVEPELTRGKKLDAEGWAQLKLECRLAKETLFSHPGQDSLPLVVAGRGKKLLGGTMKAALTQTQLKKTVLEGYYPELAAGKEALPQKAKRTGFSEYGLPYASEPGITRHLAAFLMRHAKEGEEFLKIDALLFNGGALKPTLIRDRVSSIVGQWMRDTSGSELKDPRPLIYDEGDEVLEIAVARGAAYFGLVREGLGLKVGGGSPREYFLGLSLEEGEELSESQEKVVCIAPRGMQDGQTIEVADREFNLVTNRPVKFPLFATTSPRHDPVGSVVVLDKEELHQLPPLQTVVKFGKQKAGTKVPVRIQVRRTEIGTLELSCLSRMSGARFKLEFDLRGISAEGPEGPAENTSSDSSSDNKEPFGGAGTRAPPTSGEVEGERLGAAKTRLGKTFAEEKPRPAPEGLMKGLEEDLALGRDDFSLPILRTLAEELLDLMEQRGLSDALEARWLNVVGFCLRPGFGVPMDDWRTRQLWKIHSQGLLFPGNNPSELNWWILWRRVAGGLSRGHQEELASKLFPLLVPSLMKRAKRKPPKPKSQEAAEMWRAAASLEQIGAKSRAQLGTAMMELIETKKAPKGALWCMSRIGARKLLYGPREATVRAATTGQWVERLMALKKPPKDENLAGCLISLARLTGDRQFDLPDDLRAKVDSFLEQQGAKDKTRLPLKEIVHLDRQSERIAFGEGLPTGISLT